MDVLKPRRARNGEASQFFEKAMRFDSDACLLWPFSTNRNGYAILGYEGKTRIAHRYLLCVITDEWPTGQEYEAAHSCGNRRCLNPRHLSWKTPKENEHDKRVHGTFGKKLSEAEARMVLSDSRSNVELAEELGVDYRHIWGIRAGLRWACLQDTQA